MENLFLKDNILQSRKNDNTGKNALKLIKLNKQNEFLFEKNIYQFIELIDFFKNPDDVFVLTGYALCGKSLMTSVIPQILKETAVIHNFKCTPSSTLDDLLLTFFETFKDYAQRKLVHIPKTDIQNFQERINIYLTKCENPIVIIIDGLNEIEDKNNRDLIMNFLSQAVGFENIKLVVTTRAFDISDIKNINLKVYTSVIKSLTLEDLREYCLINVINSEKLEEFYKLSRGHYYNLNLTMSYIQPTNLTIKEFIDEVKNSSKNIDELVVVKNLSLIPQSYTQLLWIIASSRFGMPKANLLSVSGADEEDIIFLQKKGIVEIFKDTIFLKDYYKKEIVKTIEPLAHNNILKGIIKFLEAQLPLKPSLRELKLSRLTIRNEIEYLNKIINKTQPKAADKNKTSLISILGYSKQYKTAWDGFDDIIMPKNPKEENKNSKKHVEDDITDVENKHEISEQENKETDFKVEITALNFAKMLKNKYSYADALVQYSDALDEAMAQKDTILTISILKDIAECYFKLGDYQSSVENYGKAHELAKKENHVNECYDIMLQIAQIYKSQYRKDLACEIYQDIINQENVDEAVKLKAELNLFETNFSKLTPKEILKKYYDLLEKSIDYKDIQAKINFRLGFLYDKGSSFDLAIKYYKASVESCSDYSVNENLSSCYYNLAEIYSDKKEYDTALDYYLKSFATDEITKNTEGMIITVKKIAKIYERKENPKALEYYEKGLELAKLLNDNYPLACAFLDLGDYYYRQKKDMEALKIYINALKIMKNQLTHENEVAIKDRINDLRVRMGYNVVEKVIKEFM